MSVHETAFHLVLLVAVSTRLFNPSHKGAGQLSFAPDRHRIHPIGTQLRGLLANNHTAYANRGGTSRYFLGNPYGG